MSTPPIKVPASAPNTSGDPRTTTMHSSNEVPFLCLSARFMLISSFDAWQHVWCLLVHFMLIGDCDCPIYTVKMCGKLKIEFTQNDLLFNYLFYAFQHVLCLSALLTLVSSFDACQFFSCLSAIAIFLFMPSECAENWKSSLLKTTSFLIAICAVWVLAPAKIV